VCVEYQLLKSSFVYDWTEGTGFSLSQDDHPRTFVAGADSIVYYLDDFLGSENNPATLMYVLSM
jgi:hypothetical protein